MKSCFQFRRRKKKMEGGKNVTFYLFSNSEMGMTSPEILFFSKPMFLINLIWQDILVHMKYLLPKNMLLSEFELALAGLQLPRKKGWCTTLMNTEAVGY